MSSFDYDVATMGFSQNALRLFTANTAPQMNVSNYSSPVEATGFALTTPTWSFQPTVTKLMGNHAVRVGYDFRVYQENSKGQTYQAGQYHDSKRISRAPPIRTHLCPSTRARRRGSRLCCFACRQEAIFLFWPASTPRPNIMASSCRTTGRSRQSSA